MANQKLKKLKIAYSCNGEGLGHGGRMATLVPELESFLEIGLFSPVNLFPFLRDKLPRRRLFPVPGFHFFKEKDRIRYFKTFLVNLGGILSAPFAMFRLAQYLKKQGYQAVISDFEPILAWAGFLAGLPVLQLNHPGIILKHRSGGFDAWLARRVAQLMEGPWSERIHVSFFGGDAGPLVRKTLLEKVRFSGDSIVVYLREGYGSTVLPAFEKLASEFDHLNWKVFPDPQANYEKSLAGCLALVTSAGHQSLSEALVLGKPILAIPQTGQAEQKINAEMLEKSGRGQMGSLQSFEADLRRFLLSLPQLQRACRFPEPEGFRLSDSLPEVLGMINLFLKKRVDSPSKTDKKLIAL